MNEKCKEVEKDKETQTYVAFIEFEYMAGILIRCEAKDEGEAADIFCNFVKNDQTSIDQVGNLTKFCCVDYIYPVTHTIE